MHAHVLAALALAATHARALVHTVLDCSVIVRDIDSRLGKREREAVDVLFVSKGSPL
jgi:hypothetical protein